MKPGKVLCCMFFLAILRAYLCTRPGKVQKVVMCVYTTNQSVEALRLCNSYIVDEHKTNDVQDQRPSNMIFSELVNLSLF